MRRPLRNVVGAVLAVICGAAPASAQMGGARAGVEQYGRSQAGGSDAPALLSREAVESSIAIDGRAEVRLKPTRVRIVLALTSEAPAAAQCQAAIRSRVDTLRAAWRSLSLSEEQIVEDFIAVLPTYQWSVEKMAERNVNVEKQTGFQMQTNLHLDLPNDDTPSKALRIAFEKGVTDIIAFDYFSPDLEKAKSHARTAAMKSAKEKAEMLLSVFETRPPAINVQEQTVVRKPDALYESFTNAVGGEMANGWRDHNLPSFSAPRPKNTYYKGFQSTEDIVGGGLPMEMEISVVSSVRIYYESPAAAKREKKEEGKK